MFILSKKEWFNVIATIQDNGVRYYINIASPSVIDKGFIKFIDYDLDLKVYPDGFVKVLDTNEFKAHCEQFGYSEELQNILRHSLEMIRERVANKVEPFNEETVKSYIKNYEEFVSNQELKDKQKPQ